MDSTKRGTSPASGIIDPLCEDGDLEASRAVPPWRSCPASLSPPSWLGPHWTGHSASRTPGEWPPLASPGAPCPQWEVHYSVAGWWHRCPGSLSLAWPNMVSDVAPQHEVSWNHRACSTSFWETRIPGSCLVRASIILVCLGLKGFQRYGSFSVKSGEVPCKPEWIGHPSWPCKRCKNQFFTAPL